MKIDLKGCHAVVGGATRGLGLATARQLAASGASVTLMARNEAKLKAARDSLPAKEGQRHDYLEVDYRDFSGFQQRTTSFLKVKK